jgi:hypothetical protein
MRPGFSLMALRTTSALGDQRRSIAKIGTEFRLRANEGKTEGRDDHSPALSGAQTTERKSAFRRRALRIELPHFAAKYTLTLLSACWRREISDFPIT